MPKGSKRTGQKRLEPGRPTTLKAEFDAAHADGMAALKRGDYDAFGNAIERERKVIDAMGARIKSAKKRGK